MIPQIPQNFLPVQAHEPKTTNLAIAGAYISTKLVNGRLWVVVWLQQAVGHATAITIKQATTVAGGSAKAITKVVPIWAAEDLATSAIPTRQTDAVSYTVAADIKKKLVIFQIDPATLDLANGFDCVNVNLAASSQASNIAHSEYLLPLAYGGDPAVDPTAD